MSALAAFLAGLETVRECVEDPEFGAYMRRAIFDEILPLLPQPEEETRPFAERVVERLANPSIKHQLLSIALNSVAKYRVRVLPSLLLYRAARGHPPSALTFSLAALLAFYRGTEIREGALCGSRAGETYLARDDREVLVAFADAWRAFGAHGNADILCRTILARTDFWGEDLSGMRDLLERVTAHVTRIVREGIRPALRALG